MSVWGGAGWGGVGWGGAGQGGAFSSGQNVRIHNIASYSSADIYIISIQPKNKKQETKVKGNSGHNTVVAWYCRIVHLNNA